MNLKIVNQKKMSLYNIFTEFELIVIYYSGELGVSDLKECMRSISLDPNFSEEYDIVSDFRDSNLNIHINDLSEYIDYLIDDLKMINKRKSILLTSKPNQVALSMVFSKKMRFTPLSTIVCSTTEAVIPFLNKEGLDRTKLNLMIEDIMKSAAK